MLFFDNLQDVGLLILRIFIGIIFIYHGSPKLFFPKKSASEISWSVGSMVILAVAEFFSGISMVLGMYTEIAAIILSIIMLGAMYLKTTKWKVPFYSRSSTGWEYDFMILGGTLALLFLGAGSISLDAIVGIFP